MLLQTQVQAQLQRATRLRRAFQKDSIFGFQCRQRLSTAKSTTTTAPAGVDGLPLISTTLSPPVRPFFPWRHEPLGIELPRLLPGTAEYRDSIRFTDLGRRFVAHWFLNGSVWETVFAFRQYQQELADNAAYAFSQALSGIVHDIYKIPTKLNYTDTGDVYIKVDENRRPESSKVATTPRNNYWPLRRRRRKLKKTTVRRERRKEVSTVAKLQKRSRPTTKQKLQTLQQQQQRRRPWIVKPQTKQTRRRTVTPQPTLSDSLQSRNMDHMVIEKLRNLYESAHEAGRNQLLIRLECQPLEAHFLDLIAIPYVTREEAAVKPEKLAKMKRLRHQPANQGFGTIMEVISEDMDEKSRLETTVELQVYIVCRERFQVLDRMTGRVLQGTDTFEAQRVGHLVRFECTCHMKPTDRVHSAANWQISDIDDLLGPVPWYGSHGSE